MDCEEEDTIDQILGTFKESNQDMEIIKKIGHGSYGTIFLCRDNCDNEYALKISSDKRSLGNEFYACENFKHNNVAKFYSYGEGYVLMDFYAKGDLHDLIVERPLSNSEVLSIFT